MSTSTAREIVAALDAQKTGIQIQIVNLLILGQICERTGGVFIGAGVAVFCYSFFLDEVSQLGAVLAGSAAPFTLAGFLFIAATNYQQQRQFQIADRQDIDRQIREIQEREATERSRREQLVSQMLTKYIELRDSTSILGGWGAQSEMAKGPAVFKYLVEQWRIEVGIPLLESAARGGQIDQTSIARVIHLNNVKRRLAPIVQLVDTIIALFVTKEVDEQNHIRALVKSRLDDPEIDILSVVQSTSQREPTLTLRSWLDDSRS